MDLKLALLLALCFTLIVARHADRADLDPEKTPQLEKDVAKRHDYAATTFHLDDVKKGKDEVAEHRLDVDKRTALKKRHTDEKEKSGCCG